MSRLGDKVWVVSDSTVRELTVIEQSGSTYKLSDDGWYNYLTRYRSLCRIRDNQKRGR